MSYPTNKKAKTSLAPPSAGVMAPQQQATPFSSTAQQAIISKAPPLQPQQAASHRSVSPPSARITPDVVDPPIGLNKKGNKKVVDKKQKGMNKGMGVANGQKSMLSFITTANTRSSPPPPPPPPQQHPQQQQQQQQQGQIPQPLPPPSRQQQQPLTTTITTTEAPLLPTYKAPATVPAAEEATPTAQPVIISRQRFDEIIERAKTSWLTTDEVFQVLSSLDQLGIPISDKPPSPISGGVFFVDSKLLPDDPDRKGQKIGVRADGIKYTQKLNKNTGKMVLKETYGKPLKVNHQDVLQCYKSSSDEMCMERHVYRLLQHNGIHMIHYLNTNGTIARRRGQSTSNATYAHNKRARLGPLHPTKRIKIFTPPLIQPTDAPPSLKLDVDAVALLAIGLPTISNPEKSMELLSVLSDPKYQHDDPLCPVCHSSDGTCNCQYEYAYYHGYKINCVECTSLGIQKAPGYGWVVDGKCVRTHCLTHAYGGEAEGGEEGSKGPSHVGPMWPYLFCKQCYNLGLPPKHARWGFDTGRSSFPLISCSDHKLPGMVTTKRSICQACHIVSANYGWVVDGKHFATHCGNCREPGMSLPASCYCEVCEGPLAGRTRASFGPRSQQGELFKMVRCARHKLPGDVLRSEWLASKVLLEYPVEEGVNPEQALLEVMADFCDNDDEEEEEDLVAAKEEEEEDLVAVVVEEVVNTGQATRKVMDLDECIQINRALVATGVKISNGSHTLRLRDDNISREHSNYVCLLHGNGGIYTGVTCQKPQTRWNQHMAAAKLQGAGKGRFARMLYAAGANHSFVTVSTGRTGAESYGLEFSLIDKLRSHYKASRTGCNSTHGNRLYDGNSIAKEISEASKFLEEAGFA